jgi:hypothetical protein
MEREERRIGDRNHNGADRWKAWKVNMIERLE